MSYIVDESEFDQYNDISIGYEGDAADNYCAATAQNDTVTAARRHDSYEFRVRVQGAM